MTTPNKFELLAQIDDAASQYGSYKTPSRTPGAVKTKKNKKATIVAESKNEEVNDYNSGTGCNSKMQKFNTMVVKDRTPSVTSSYLKKCNEVINYTSKNLLNEQQDLVKMQKKIKKDYLKILGQNKTVLDNSVTFGQ